MHCLTIGFEIVISYAYLLEIGKFGGDPKMLVVWVFMHTRLRVCSKQIAVSGKKSVYVTLVSFIYNTVFTYSVTCKCIIFVFNNEFINASLFVEP